MMTDAPSPGACLDLARPHLQRYLDELYAWNERVNLTAVPRQSAWSKHIDEVVDMLSTVAISVGATLADVGSGGGVPGIPLALLRSDLQVTLIESDQRKAGFLIHVAGVLGLTTLTVLATRAETVARDPQRRECYDVVVTRATAAAPVLCELCLPLVATGGQLLALVSDATGDALASLTASSACGGAPPEAITERLLRIAKVGPTPERYPRRVGVPQRSPIA